MKRDSLSENRGGGGGGGGGGGDSTKHLSVSHFTYY